MKNNKKLLVLSLSLALAAGAVGTGAYFLANKGATEAETKKTMDEEVTVADELGMKIRLNAVTPTKKVNVYERFGYQLVKTDGAKSTIRVYGIVDDYANLTGMKVTTKVVAARDDKTVAPDEEEVIKDETTLDVDSVYASIKDAGKVTWVGEALSAEAKAYYVVYTLKNVPLAHDFDTIIVKFEASSTGDSSYTATVNVEGIKGAPSDFTFTSISEEENTYYATPVSGAKGINGLSIVPGNKNEYDDGYAVKGGTVIALGNPDNQYSSGAAYSGNTEVTEVILPDTIQSIGKYAFYGARNLKKINLPRDLESMGTDAFYYSYSSKLTLDELDYQAVNLSSESAIFTCDIARVNVSSAVASLPNKFMSSGTAVSEVRYDGTVASFNAMKTNANAGNGLFVERLIGTDTVFATITLHLGEASLGGKTGDVVVDSEFIVGKAFANPGSPILDGMEFKGWALSEGAETFYDFASLVEGDLDLYPIFGQPGPGISLANPLSIDPTWDSFTAILYPGKRFEYLKFTLPEEAAEGFYYLSIDDDASILDADASVGVTSLSYSNMYLAAVSEEGEEIVEAKNTSYNASIAQESLIQRDQSADIGLRFYAKAGETYYFKASLYENASYASRAAYGEIAFKLHTYDHDYKNNAIAFNAEADNRVVWEKGYQHVVYKFEPTNTDSAALVLTRHSKWTNLTVIDESNPTTKIIDNGTTSDSTYSFSYEAGHTYYFDIYSNGDYTASTDVTLALESVPEGFDKAHALTLIPNGEYVDVANVSGNGAYYKVVLENAASIKFEIDGASTSYRAQMSITKEDGKAVDTIQSPSSGGYYSSSYSANFSREEALEAGTYYILVNYTSTYASYAGLKFRGTLIEAGSTIASAIDLGEATLPGSFEVASSEEGRFYKFTVAADGIYNLTFAGEEGAFISLHTLSSSGTASNTTGSRQGKFGVRLLSAYVYYAKLYGASGVGSLSIEEATAYGQGFDSAIEYAADGDGYMVLNAYCTNSSYESRYIKFTTDEAGVYRLYSTGASNMYLNGVHKDDDDHTSFATSDYLYKENRDSVHSEFTKGSGFYAEIALEANTVYYAKVELPAASAVSVESPFKFGLGLVEEGSTYTTALNCDFSGESVILTGSSDGIWHTFTGAAEKEDLTLTAAMTGEASVEFYVGSVGTTPTATLSAATDTVTLNLNASQKVYVLVKGASSVEIGIAHEEHIDFFAFSSPTTSPTDSGTDTECYWYATHNDAAGTYVTSSYFNSCKFTFYVAITDRIASGVMSCRIKVNDVHTDTKDVTFSIYKKEDTTLTPIEDWENLHSVEDGTYQFDVTGGDTLVFEYRTHGDWASSTSSAWVDSFAMVSFVKA